MAADPSSTGRLADLLHGELPGLLAYACALTRHVDQAEDLVQETCLAVLDQNTGWDGERDLGAYLRGIVRHKFTDMIRRKRSIPMDPEVIAVIEDGWAAIAARHQGGSVIEALEHCLDRLPPSLRDLVERHHQHEEPLTVLAAQCGLAIDVVKKRLVRGRRLLVECMAGSGFVGTGRDPRTNSHSEDAP
jgi:RNA polymerase sigma factor (sigma-70 family)